MNKIKRLSYSYEMDPHFIAISILTLLFGLKRFNLKSKFKYPQKIASLVFFINNSKNVNLFKLKFDDNYDLKLVDYEKLNSIFLKSKLIEPQVNRVLNSLEKNGYIESHLIKDEICIILKKEKCSFINKPIFKELSDNSRALKDSYSYISSITYDTYYENFFKGIEFNE